MYIKYNSCLLWEIIKILFLLKNYTYQNIANVFMQFKKL